MMADPFPDPRLSRRGMMVAASAAAALLGSARAPLAEAPAELSVTEALRKRRSTRAFTDRPIDPALLAQLLWAGFGVNRPDSGLHTAPSWYGVSDVSLHVATGGGVLAYDPAHDRVAQTDAGDIRKILSSEPFVATAPVCLIYTSDLALLAQAPTEGERIFWATVNAAMAAENVYVFAAAQGLGTCLVGGFDQEAIAKSLKLRDGQLVTFIQPVGWPA